jgi:hypothetical protein
MRMRWGYEGIKCCEYLDLGDMMKFGGGENYVIMSFINYVLYLILLRSIEG